MTEANLLFATGVFYFFSLIPYVFIFFKKSAPRIEKCARALVVLGFLTQTAALAFRWKITGHAPMTNMYESLVFFSWAFVIAYLWADFALKISRLGFFFLVGNLIILMQAFSQDAVAKPLMPALQSNWLALHVVTCFFSYAAFAVSFIASIAYFLPLPKKFFSHEQLDQVIYKSILFGFPLLTLGVASGAVWANEAWGQYWSWDPKETWALVTWMIYVLYLHLRLMNWWREKMLVWVALVGFLFVIFTYVGVNLFLPGLHSYTR
jgi:cytochrome c-type biogenesis protein CcsB